MRVKPDRCPWSLTLGCLLAWAPQVFAQSPLQNWEIRRSDRGVYDASSHLHVFTSSGNLDSNGALVAPYGFNQYLRIEEDLNLTYGVSSQFSIFGTLSWARVDLDHATRPGNSYGLTESLLGFNYQLFSFESLNTPPSPVDPGDSNALRKILFQAQVSFPAYNNATADSNLLPRLGDQTIDITAGIFASLRLIRSKNWELLLAPGFGYTYRTESFSSELPWSLGFQYIPTRFQANPSRDFTAGFAPGFQGGLSIMGVHSLQTDKRSASSSTASLGTGGSFMTGATNSSLITLREEASYAIEEDLQFSLDLTESIWGISAPNGFSVGLTLRKLFGITPPSKSRAKMGPEEYGKSNKGFVEYTAEAKVLRSLDRLNLVKLNKGSHDGIEVDQIFDIFSVKPDGSLSEPIARGKIISTKTDEAALSVMEYYKKTWIEEGYVAKRPLQ